MLSLEPKSGRVQPALAVRQGPNSAPEMQQAVVVTASGWWEEGDGHSFRLCVRNAAECPSMHARAAGKVIESTSTAVWNA